ncbi:MAG: hypothetical protein KBG80_00480 [Breznakibacter sp.]|nr:hypothetical protein [Breznakibacter sp.]
MKKFLKITGFALAIVIVIPAIWLTYLYQSADMKNPNIPVDLTSYQVLQDSGYTSCNASKLRHNKNGLWEIYLEGDAINRGTTLGKLTKELLHYQEQTFIDQIREIIPSDSYLKFLRFFTIIFNRNMGAFVPEEFREEIYGMSLSCSDEFDAIGPAYERQLNYHGAHDIGHTMQEYMLVGCSSFGVWENKSSDSTLLIGRNFDFFVGDNFAKNKLITFVSPSKGYKYAAIGWAGMIGVLSGMNEKGLTITINAAKGDIPTSAAMPISILAREILQYASTIDEAYKIAQSRHTFVSESLLIGSAIDKKAAIIEKTPYQIALFQSSTNQIICTNHYQADNYKKDPKNIENIQNSDSPYRYARLEELLAENKTISPIIASTILRDRHGKNNTEIGFTNEKSLNQDIAHHSVIFKPQQGLMWVSTSPWQSGEYVCYDLNKIFNGVNFSKEIYVDSLTIAADSTFLKTNFQKIIDYRLGVRELKKSMTNELPLSAQKLDDFIQLNPNFYYVYTLLGDYHHHFADKEKALWNWEKALTLEIPRKNERDAIENKINSVRND